jgi:hypothetical protein
MAQPLAQDKARSDNGHKRPRLARFRSMISYPDSEREVPGLSQNRVRVSRAVFSHFVYHFGVRRLAAALDFKPIPISRQALASGYPG